MIKVNFGCGGHKLAGWENHDLEVDIRQPLPYEDSSVDFVLAEHVLEHVTMHEGFIFLEEVFRILKPSGVAQILVPDVTKIRKNKNHPYFDSYLKFYQSNKWTDGTYKSSIIAMAFNYCHMALWTEELLLCVMDSIGYNAIPVVIDNSEHEELKNISRHWQAYQGLQPWVDGKTINEIDTACVEGTK